MSVAGEPSEAGGARRPVDRGLLLLVGGALLLIAVGLASMALWGRRAPDLAPAGTPEGVVQRFYQAAYAGDYDAARAMLSAEQQRRLSAGDLRERLSYTLRQSQVVVGAAAVRAGTASVPVTQTHYDQGGLFGSSEWTNTGEAQLTREGDSWKIADWGIAFW